MHFKPGCDLILINVETDFRKEGRYGAREQVAINRVARRKPPMIRKSEGREGWRERKARYPEGFLILNAKNYPQCRPLSHHTP